MAERQGKIKVAIREDGDNVLRGMRGYIWFEFCPSFQTQVYFNDFGARIRSFAVRGMPQLGRIRGTRGDASADNGDQGS